MASGDERDGVALTHLDEALFDGSGVAKRDLVDYIDRMADLMVPHLADRALSVVRVRAGQRPFMQKNLPDYAPEWIRSVTVRADRTKRDVRYALADDRRTLLWFANQRAVEYHAALSRATRPDRQTHLILDLDPPTDVTGDEGFRLAAQTAHLVRRALDEAGLAGAVKTSGAKGLHIFVPLDEASDTADVAAATRALAARAAALDPALATTEFVVDERHGRVFVDSTRAGGATMVAVYSPRIRSGVPVSFPVAWDEVDAVDPRDHTVKSVPDAVAGRDLWAELMPGPQTLPADLIAEGHEIPIARVVAMHEGKRRARARREAESGSSS